MINIYYYSVIKLIFIIFGAATQKYKLDILLTWKLSGKQSKQHQIPHLKQKANEICYT